MDSYVSLPSTLLPPSHLTIPPSLPPSYWLCSSTLTYLLPSLPPSLPSYLPAAAQGLLALTVFPRTKERVEVKKGKLMAAMDAFVLCSTLPPILPC